MNFPAQKSKQKNKERKISADISLASIKLEVLIFTNHDYCTNARYVAKQNLLSKQTENFNVK